MCASVYDDSAARLARAHGARVLAGGERHALGGTCYRLGGMG